MPSVHHVENEKELLFSRQKTPSPHHESRAVPVRCHRSPVTYTRCGDRVTDETTGTPVHRRRATAGKASRLRGESPSGQVAVHGRRRGASLSLFRPRRRRAWRLLFRPSLSAFTALTLLAPVQSPPRPRRPPFFLSPKQSRPVGANGSETGPVSPPSTPKAASHPLAELSLTIQQ